MNSTNIILHHGQEGNVNFIQIYFKKPPLDIKPGEAAKGIVFSNNEKANNNLGIEVTLEFNNEGKIFGIEIHSKEDIIPDELK